MVWQNNKLASDRYIYLKIFSSNLTMGAIIQQIKTSLLNLLGQAIEAMPSIAAAVVVIVLTNTAAKFVSLAVSAPTQQTVKSLSLRSLLVQIAFALTWAAGSSIACVIAFPALRPGDIIGLLGLGSVAVSFAFQDIFKNFLAGILMLLHEPFQLGDQIVVEGFEGTVEEISMR
ncbi:MULTISPECIES: mechanosensitive ion channel domain-containing protein [unclassified Microcoleus]|uniref:mechanosensitive ion channel family protein n=1 Tax=unclassified Microcoleus TaxID=2642155 RepID=UPI0025D19CF3|nr:MULTISPECIES: mechanosensitive ion channel domain-containing protein [unclassified Microcoleus]